MSVVCINIARKEMDGSHRVKGQAELALLVTKNDVLLNVDDSVTFKKIKWFMGFCAAYSKSFKIIDSELGVALVATKR